MNVKNGIASSVSLLHDAPQTIRHGLEQRWRQQSQFDAEQTEDHAARGERKRDRIADQQTEHQAAEHQRRHVLRQERVICSPPRLRQDVSASSSSPSCCAW